MFYTLEMKSGGRMLERINRVNQLGFALKFTGTEVDILGMVMPILNGPVP